ncbi:MAG: hypothetical protein KGQ41_05455 [Alphaproteobacteria bacterium]|nr:hypothetical protein [Alphaproteobacteria bacterium]
MSISIDNAFVKQFEREVFEAYQRTGSKLRPTVRSKNNVKGSSAVFQKVGTGLASTKSAHGMVPVMNLNHTSVEATLQDYYAGDWVDKLDELKVNHDERQVIANAGAYALGRKTDELIINALNASTNTVTDTAQGLTIDKVLEAFEKLGAQEVPDDGQRTAIVGWKQWSQLLALKEFSNADYVGSEDLPFTGTQAVKWLGTLWIPHGGLPFNSTTGVRRCFWYHKTAIGHASGQDVETDITWHGDRAAYFVNSMMSQGAALIEGNGVVVMTCDETPA